MSNSITNTGNIQYLKNNQINYAKWDACIDKSLNGITYAYSWYLDCVCPEWEALVEDDYNTVMPLTAGKKYNISYLYQPWFAQQLGIFSLKMPNKNAIEAFIKKIPTKYKFIEIRLNTYNYFDDPTFEIKENKTYQLDLVESYNHIFRNFSVNTRRNLSKGLNNNILISKGIAINTIIEFYKNTVGDPILKLKEDTYNILQRIVSYSLNKKIGEAYGAYNQHNELCAMAFFLNTHQKSIFLISAANEMGKENRAMFMLVNYYISKYSERNLVLDFEGSNDEGIARFYKGFGAQPSIYLSVKKNNLPWYAKLFKK